MAVRDVTVENSVEDILQQIQREYLARDTQEAPAAIASPHSAEILNINAAADTRRGSPAPTAADTMPNKGGSAANALAQLATIYRGRRRASELPMGNKTCTLDDVVREMMSPMVQGWLEQKLPEIVERLVAVELSRVIGQAIAT